MWVEDKVMFLPLLHSVLFKCPKYYFHPVTKEMYKYLAVVCCSILLRWQQVGLLAGVAFALIKEKQQTGPTKQCSGLAWQLFIPRGVGSTKPIWHI